MRRKSMDENGSFCENCSCPWSTGYNRLRLLAPPRKLSDIRFLDKRKEVKRISRRQRLRLSLHEDGQNALVSECKVCKGEVVKKFTLPKKKEKKLNSVNVEDEKKLKKKKKKKRNKDFQDFTLMMNCLYNIGTIVPMSYLLADQVSSTTSIPDRAHESCQTFRFWELARAPNV
ncbi:hypothetical protein Avbf_00092 [Armadillidium vulgare]|nr:hypothetical protein Avbf_00092 [Armadillidium vulgare]